jgi:hypothetical protein
VIARLAVVLLVLVAGIAGAKSKSKAKPKGKAPKVLESALLGVQAAQPTEDLLKTFPKLHKHPGERTTSWDACDRKESIRYVFYEEPFLAGRVTSISASRVDSVLCAHDGAVFSELKVKVATPRGVRLGASEKEIVALYGQPADASESDTFRTLSYRRPLEVKGVEQPLRVVLSFELRAAKLTGIRLVVEPGT